MNTHEHHILVDEHSNVETATAEIDFPNSTIIPNKQEVTFCAQVAVVLAIFVGIVVITLVALFVLFFIRLRC